MALWAPTQGRDLRGANPWLRVARRKPLIPSVSTRTPPPPHPLGPPPPPLLGADIPATCSLQTRQPREGDAKTGTALGWGARAETARALFLRRPRAGFRRRVLPSNARPREPTWFSARQRLLREGQARARAAEPPPPQPVSARAQQSGGGGEGSPGGARTTAEPALPSVRGRARASQHRPPLSPRPSSRPGRWGEGVPTSLHRSLPRARTTDSQPPPLSRHGLLLTMFPEAKRR